MPRLLPVALAVLIFSAGEGRAQSFAIDLKVQGAKDSVTVHAVKAETGLPLKDQVKRSVLKVKAGEKIAVEYTIRSTETETVYKSVVVHFFVVKEMEAGQTVIPKLNKDVVAESALSMDFRPKDQAEGKANFVIPNAGPYLLRLETLGAAVGEGQEVYAALDLVVE